MIQGIKNIIFDLGGVILNIDYKRPQQELEKLGIKNIDVLYSKKNQSTLFDLLETGKISEQEFISKIKDLTDKPISDAEILHAWNSILLDFPLRRLQILQQLQLHYNLFLLSNTNEIHEKAFNDMLRIQCGFPSLALFFDKVYYSHRIGMRKPNTEIFEFVLSQNNLKPEETLFIDDSIQHIEAATKLGIQTIHIKDGMTIEKDVFLPK